MRDHLSHHSPSNGPRRFHWLYESPCRWGYWANGVQLQLSQCCPHLVAQSKHLPWTGLPLGTIYSIIAFLGADVFEKSPGVKTLLASSSPQKRSLLDKEKQQFDPNPQPPTAIYMQFSAVNSQNPKPTQSFLIFSPLILLSLLLWKIFVAPHQSCFAKIPSWQSFYFLLKLTLMAT